MQNVLIEKGHSVVERARHHCPEVCPSLQVHHLSGTTMTRPQADPNVIRREWQTAESAQICVDTDNGGSLFNESMGDPQQLSPHIPSFARISCLEVYHFHIFNTTLT
jgi:hypothetical protein